MRKCIICHAPIEPANPDRPARRDKLTCGTTCRKRLQRLKAGGRMPRLLLPGQLELPLPLTGDITALSSAPTNRQPPDRPGSTITG